MGAGNTGSEYYMNDYEQSLLSEQERSNMQKSQRQQQSNPSTQGGSNKVKSSFLGSAGNAVKASFTKFRGGGAQAVVPLQDGNATSINSNDESLNCGYIDFSFMNEQRNLEKEETLIYSLFQKKIKRWSWYVLIVTSYILLNVFIGFSSAPFYRKVKTCSRFDPTPVC